MEEPARKIAARLKGPDPEHLDPPLRELVGLINSAAWAQTFGCCAGPASHPESGDTYGFYISIAVRRDEGARNLASWLREVLARAPHPGARVQMRELDKHGLGHLEGMRGVHVSIEWLSGAGWPEKALFTRQAILAMHDSWALLFGPERSP